MLVRESGSEKREEGFVEKANKQELKEAVRFDNRKIAEEKREA
jgi:uncharacterized membrane protein